MTSWEFLKSSVKCVLKDRRYKLFFIASIGIGWLVFTSLHPSLPSSKNPIFLYSNHFRDDLKRIFIQAISHAQHSIILQIYGLSDPDLITLLKKKKAQGIQVKIFYDKNGSSPLPKCLGAIPIQCSGLMHRKILVIDHDLTLIGTANLTTQSLKMHDNVVLGIKNKKFATFFANSTKEIKHTTIKNATITSFLLPSKKALQTLCSHLDQAKTSIHIAMFTITHPKIIETLINAKNRGIHVNLAIDHYTAEGASKKAIRSLQEAGITIFTSTGSQLLHHKWAIIDENTFILGSANWTISAFEKNQDSLLILQNCKQKFSSLWKSIVITCEKKVPSNTICKK